ncbi:unnamed protein product [Rotaria socialis]|uniref:Uncharacterized protein n=2 Tax=Rotaria socialis TaxID=392032 RepID=A0A818GKJ1_9BILA|nr:unnamed protein product [Rotaria socialis]CAF4686481.1 unnamed protein product [Rotaria socialis]
MFSSNNQNDHNKLDRNSALLNKCPHEANSSLSISDVLFPCIDEKSDILLKLDDLCVKQTKLEDSVNHVQKNLITRNLVDNYKKQIDQYQILLTCMDNLQEFKDKWAFFRIFIERFCLDLYNWKPIAHSIYHINYLINNLDNCQMKEFIRSYFVNVLNSFILFVKYLITIQIKSQKQQSSDQITGKNDSSRKNNIFVSNVSQINFDNQIEQHVQNLKNDINSLKELILTAKQRFSICQADTNAIQTLVDGIDNINLNNINFDKQDQHNIRLFKLKQDLSQKSNKTDLIQLKASIDNQLKQIIELNKQNAMELERIKLMNTATCESRRIQTILSSNLSSQIRKPKRMHSYQSSRPYITLELDDIRKYQRQALLKSPYGTIPLYRRQAWAAANLLQDHQSLDLLRYTQNSLRMQIHHLLGYDPSDICKSNKKKKINKKSNIKIFNTGQDILIAGNNNQFYRGHIDTCQIVPLKSSQVKKSQIQTNIDENNEIINVNIDQLNQTNKTIVDEHLFEYLDWQTQFNEQDLPDELCEELFQHWKSIIFEDQPHMCNSKSTSTLCQEKYDLEQNSIDAHVDTASSSSSLLKDIYDDHCLCSDCSCDCEKYPSDESMCACSQCACKCLKDVQNENQDTIEDTTEVCEHNILVLHQETNLQDHLINETNANEEIQLTTTNQIPILKEIQQNEEDKILISDCFMNRADRWTHQFDIFQDMCKPSSLREQKDFSTLHNISQFESVVSMASRFTSISSRLELDDPTRFRLQLLNHHR